MICSMNDCCHLYKCKNDKHDITTKFNLIPSNCFMNLTLFLTNSNLWYQPNPNCPFPLFWSVLVVIFVFFYELLSEWWSESFWICVAGDLIGCVSIGFDSELGIWIEKFEHLFLHHFGGFWWIHWHSCVIGEGVWAIVSMLWGIVRVS